ncbi:MAG: threonylcarbamoyl-AMP synthase [Myxococcaceae bacterium]|nr:threonylcarbamoyl-AMP synthase [Myxococcaceae bacterium]MBH2006431.1 threonylcarbamoyl-AMP synthase [Myxococcaceae bacterium]
MLCERLLANAENIQRAARIINQGGLVAFPTETVYGLGANGLSESSIRRVFEAKGRPAYNPLIEHVASIQQARELFVLSAEQEGLFWDLAKRYWPGPLTLVAPKSELVPSLATGGLDRVAVRVPAHPVALELLRQVGGPVVAPSANRSQRPSSTIADHVLLTLGEHIDAVLDAGPCLFGLESTVVDISQNPPRVLRLGALKLSDYAFDLAKGSQGSPGRMDKHYAPLISEMRIVASAELQNAASDTALLVYSEAEYRGRLVERLPSDPEGYAHGLFAALYRLESQKPSTLWIEAPPQVPQWASIWDRLGRAVQDVEISIDFLPH